MASYLEVSPWYAAKLGAKVQWLCHPFLSAVMNGLSLPVIRLIDWAKTPDNASEAEEEKIKQAEGARMLDFLKKAKGSDCYVFALVIKGKEIDSVELSEKISELTVSGKSHLVFIIGGSLGLSDEVIAESDYKLSFSKLTFPHQLMRLILLEQIYRAFRIKMGEPYHK